MAKSGTENLKPSSSETRLDWKLLSQVGVNIRGKIGVWNFPLHVSVSERLRKIGLSAEFQNKLLKYTLTLSGELHLTISKLGNKHIHPFSITGASVVAQGLNHQVCLIRESSSKCQGSQTRVFRIDFNLQTSIILLRLPDEANRSLWKPCQNSRFHLLFFVKSCNNAGSILRKHESERESEREGKTEQKGVAGRQIPTNSAE